MRDVAERQLTFAEAIRESLDQVMEKDSRVIVIGEGVPDPKAIFNTTSGLRQKYGARRVFDMPLSENGLTGACIGAALSGIRPVMIHQRIDFALLAMDQLVNNAAKWHYMFNGKASVPMVVRMIVGRGWGQGPQHSQSLQAMFAMVPGLKVVMPTTAHDAKGMMIAAIEDDNPVLFIEHRWLHHVSDNVPDYYYRVPIGQARTLHEGSDVTVAAFSYMALEALIAAKSMSMEMGIGLDVIDMRTVRPLDVESVLTSVRKTGRLIVADTAFRTGSIAGELISQVVEQAFSFLKAPPVRIASPDFPTPTSAFMAEDYYPGPQTIADAALDLMGKTKEADGYGRMSAGLVRKGPHDAPNREFSGPF
ncbi:Pyruvate dehydrogenase, E1 component, beta subunit [Candidatus Nitrospira nitrosa]|uniref:Pyruvate dehydrogenase, E1 component, beta subunit n=1 Tax=Candidatus Nitrospira nitrosa TaxID=1742972 RepID=A0A0S4LBI3_9BACT|nr:transketolase C-terminal domain-containing protein [Candidatus Nitrospira nitrosa]CUS35105.1 Pyruvate dehydrogenase, E1 component, beta subunit [Candidatus Nitrospira nitrosa]